VGYNLAHGRQFTPLAVEYTLAEVFPSADAPARTARQALLAQLDKAVSGLAQRNRSDGMIHEIRKDLKRARASLRLLRDCVGFAEYQRDNAMIRDAARPLTPVRDAKVLLEALRRWGPEGGGNGFVSRLYGVLKEQRRTAQRQLRPSELVHAARVLRAIRRRAAALPDRRLELADRAGLKRAYKSGRKAFARACKQRTDERLHEWRKQTKYFANQLEIVLPFEPKRFAKSRRRAHRLADTLGDDHDLALLTEQIFKHAKGDHAPSQDDLVQDLIGSLARERKKLQKNAFRLGRRLYASRARRYQPYGSRPAG
jgi:CHAD domain-containing protein